MILLDTWAWIEYFKKDYLVKQIIDSHECYTSAISIAEISKWALQNSHDADFLINAVKKNSIIIELEENILKEAGKNYVKMRKISKYIGMIDVIIYATAQLHKLQVLTGDPDFKNLPGIKIL